MPVYSILSTSDFPKKKKDRIVDTITNVHCETTGAPSNLVTILFLSGYQLKKRKEAVVVGNIRIGGNRTPEIIEGLRNELLRKFAKTLAIDVQRVNVQLSGVQAHWVWEHGKVVPPPGEEFKTATSKTPIK